MPKDFGIFASMQEGEEKKVTYEPKISILIPVYNGADYVADAIQSSLAQTYSNFEVVVVDDGSNDDGATERKVKAFGDRVRYFRKQNGGVASALNFGIEKCEGEYISWLSHDDIYMPDKLLKQVGYLGSGERDHVILYSDYSTFTTDVNRSAQQRLPGVLPEKFRFWITMDSALHGCSLLIPRTAFAECGRFNETLKTTQDYDLWFRIAEKYRFVHQPELFVKARLHANQGSVTLADRARKEGNQLLSNFVRNLTSNELQAGTGKSPLLSYAILATRMRSRGYLSAGQAAMRLAIARIGSAPFGETVEAIVILARGFPLTYRLKQVLKAFIPQPARQKLRMQMSRFLEPQSKLADTVRVSHYSLKRKFSEVYQKNIFEGRVSRSGAGSDLSQTAVIRSAIPSLLEDLKIDSVLDAPCGDWFWMKECDLGKRRYIGVDIVPKLIQLNRKSFESETISFRCLNLASDPLPKADAILSRDCLVHLSFADALKAIQNFKKSGAKYLITTTFVNRSENLELGTSFWRPLNKQLPPFNFPPPLRLINEGCTEGNGLFADKCLGVWKISEL